MYRYWFSLWRKFNILNLFVEILHRLQAYLANIRVSLVPPVDVSVVMLLNLCLLILTVGINLSDNPGSLIVAQADHCNAVRICIHECP